MPCREMRQGESIASDGAAVFDNGSQEQSSSRHVKEVRVQASANHPGEEGSGQTGQQVQSTSAKSGASGNWQE